jgi:hypothetical protein
VGRAGPKGKPGLVDRRSLLTEVNGHIDNIYKELDIQLKRMAQIQQQVDELRAKVRSLE